MLVIIHAYDEKSRVYRDFSYPDYDCFVNILNVEHWQYGSTRIKFLCKSSHRLVDGDKIYVIDKIFADHRANARISFVAQSAPEESKGL